MVVGFTLLVHFCNFWGMHATSGEFATFALQPTVKDMGPLELWPVFRGTVLGGGRSRFFWEDNILRTSSRRDLLAERLCCGLLPLFRAAGEKSHERIHGLLGFAFPVG